MASRNQPCSCKSGKLYRECCGKPMATSGTGRRQAVLPDGQRLPVEQVFQGAVSLHQAGRPRRAAELYRCVLAAEPRHPDALHLLGLAERQVGNLLQAVELMQSAISINPRAAIFHSNLGEALRAQARLVESEAACRRAIELDPALPEAYLNLGEALRLQQQTAAAIGAFQQALRLRPAYVDALLSLGDVLHESGRYADAEACYRQVVSLNPDNAAGLTRLGVNLRVQGRTGDAIAHYEAAIGRTPDVPELHNNLSLLYQSLGRMDDAAACLRRLLDLTPDDVTTRHMLNALEGRTTERAPPDYVRDTFDGYAETFESHLVQKLGYRIPEQLAEMVKQCWGAAASGKAALDMGCGTGLFGVAIADACRQLVGIDIAPKMIEKAREKGVYTELVVIDILPFLRDRAPECFDLVVATDVFIYLGDLAMIFAEVRRILRPGGMFAFSVESAPDDGADYLLDTTGRYRQSGRYLRGLAGDCGLGIAQLVPAVIRHQADQPVPGYLCIFTAP